MSRKYNVSQIRNKLQNQPKVRSFYGPDPSVKNQYFSRYCLIQFFDISTAAELVDVVTVASDAEGSDPAAIGKYLQLIEHLINVLYTASDARPIFEQLSGLYGLTAKFGGVLTTTLQTYVRAADQSVGDWDSTMSVLVGFLDKAACVPVAPSLESAWRFIRMGNGVHHLAAALACALDSATLNPNRVTLERGGDRVTLQYSVVASPLDKWKIHVTKPVKEIKTPNDLWADFEMLGNEGEYRGKTTVMYDWMYLDQMVAEDEARQALVALADIGNKGDEDGW